MEKKGKHGREWQECAKVRYLSIESVISTYFQVDGSKAAAEVLGLKEGEEYQVLISGSLDTLISCSPVPRACREQGRSWWGIGLVEKGRR